MSARIKPKLGSAYLIAFFSSLGFFFLMAGESSVFSLFDAFENLPVVQNNWFGVIGSLGLGLATGVLAFLTPDRYEHYFWKFTIAFLLVSFFIASFAHGPNWLRANASLLISA